MRKFDTGATRDTDNGKHDYDGYLSPLVLERFAEYMTKHRKQADGNIRASDNWKKGIPLSVYMKSLWRHFVDLWKLHNGFAASATMEDALCAVLFNVSGYLHEWLIKKDDPVEDEQITPEYEECMFCDAPIKRAVINNNTAYVNPDGSVHRCFFSGYRREDEQITPEYQKCYACGMPIKEDIRRREYVNPDGVSHFPCPYESDATGVIQ